jgi:anti-sigma regulatory factor (Ser/Thr protein kinase)
VGEPVWPSRTPAEQAEAFRHEALLNVAFDGSVQILCPYDASGLGPDVLAEAERTHPVLMRGGRSEPSRHFASGMEQPGGDGPLPAAPAGLEVLAYRDNPADARNFARAKAGAAGLHGPRLTDLVIAVGELAANTLRHTRAGGTICVWANGPEVICEVRDSGYIRDPLAGRRRPVADGGRGHGLWVVHQVCDLVEMRTSRSGTTFRLHFGIAS